MSRKQTTHFSFPRSLSWHDSVVMACFSSCLVLYSGQYRIIKTETHLDLFQQIFVVHSARTWPPYRLSHPQTVTVVLALPSRKPCSQELDQVSAGVGPINPTTVFGIQTLCLSLLFHALTYLESMKHLKFPLSFFSSSSLWQHILWYNVITITSSYYIYFYNLSHEPVAIHNLYSVVNQFPLLFTRSSAHAVVHTCIK